MGDLITLYCIMFFAIETTRNSLRIRQIITKKHPGKIMENATHLSWIMICVGLILTFTSSKLFLIIMLGTKVFAGMFVEWMNNRREDNATQMMDMSIRQLVYPSQQKLPYNGVKLITNNGGKR